MLALVQPYGIAASGGGSRILSSLVAGSPHPFISVTTDPHPQPTPDFGVHEIHLPRRQSLGWFERGRFATLVAALDLPLGSRLEHRLTEVFQSHGVTAVHTVPQAADFLPAYRAARRVGARIVVSAHDDIRYNQARSPVLRVLERQLAQVWCDAEARTAISEELGNEYNRRFGRRDYVLLTDGVQTVAPAPKRRFPNQLRVHFGGSLHWSYRPNFKVLMTALRKVQAERPALKVSLSLRGAHLDDVPSGLYVQSLPWGNQAAFEQDLKSADLLYLPLPFETKYLGLSRYSLSTKMVHYLASGTPILYHGPADAAAGRLLGRHGAALCVTDERSRSLAQALAADPSDAVTAASNGLTLAANRFNLATMRRTFWETVLPPVRNPEYAGRTSGLAVG